MGQARYRPPLQQPQHSSPPQGFSPQGGHLGDSQAAPAAHFQPATSEEPFSMGEPRYRPQPQQPYHAGPPPGVSPRAAPQQQPPATRFQAASSEEPFSMSPRGFRSPQHQAHQPSHHGHQQPPPVVSPCVAQVTSPRAAHFQAATSQEPFSINAAGAQPCSVSKPAFDQLTLVTPRSCSSWLAGC